MTTAAEHVAAQARLYGPTAEEIRRSLPEHGESVAGQLAELSARPSVERAETVIRNLDGLASLVRRYRERLVAGEGDGR